jgi:hypothetical protein
MAGCVKRVKSRGRVIREKKEEQAGKKVGRESKNKLRMSSEKKNE